MYPSGVLVSGGDLAPLPEANGRSPPGMVNKQEQDTVCKSLVRFNYW